MCIGGCKVTSPRVFLGVAGYGGDGGLRGGVRGVGGGYEGGYEGGLKMGP